MDFRLLSGDVVRDFHGEASYRFDAHGLLIVRDGEGRQFTFSPCAWSSIEEDEPVSGMLA